MSDINRLQEVYNELQQLKEERKKLKETLKDELKHHERHAQVLEEMEKIRSEKKSIEVQVQQANSQDANRIDELSVEIKSNEELMSDLAFNLLMKNETVELTDKNANRYVPQFVVRFKKDGYSDEKPSAE